MQSGDMRIARTHLMERIRAALGRSPVVVLRGPRQAGKTTVARQFLPPEAPGYFDLEDPTSLARLEEPKTALAPLEGLIVIDEIQRRPELFPLLRVLVDRPGSTSRFLVLGSASGDLLRQGSESLAGRVEFVEVGGFVLSELGACEEATLWRRGGFPRSYLAEDEADSVAWRRAFMGTLLERDLPQWGVRVAATALRRFWSMVAHYHGQTWNAAPPARSLGVSESTTRRYLDLLTDALMLRQLPPWHANLSKRQVKSPKVYVRDTGLLHTLLGLDTQKQILEHPKSGASWEGFAIEQILMTEAHDEAYFWATHQGAELDLLLLRGGRRLGVECKRVDAPRVTRSMRIALEDLELDRLAVVHPGEKRYPLDTCVEAVPLRTLETVGALFPD